MVVIILTAALLLTIVFLLKDRNSTPEIPLDTPHEQFIWKEMLNQNLLLKTTLQSHSSDYSLSETIGLWMEYAVLTDNYPLFEIAYQQLDQYFVTSQGFIHWRIKENGQTTEQVNAFMDDIRIIHALLGAEEHWNKSKYNKMARKITKALVIQGTYKQMFVDFYDWEHDRKSPSISVQYLDIQTIRRLYALGWIDQNILNQVEQVAIEASHQSSPLYPTRYHIDTNQFIQEDTVNLIEQMYTAYHFAKAGIQTDRFLAFLTQELAEHDKLYGQYDTDDLTPVVGYESPALYGLAILYTLSIEEYDMALQFYNKLQALQTKAGSFKGAYLDSSTSDTHIFDNLVPLIAERRLMEIEMD